MLMFQESEGGGGVCQSQSLEIPSFGEREWPEIRLRVVKVDFVIQVDVEVGTLKNS